METKNKVQRLYVDNQLLDIADNTKITLSIKSNLLRDVSKIVSNSTYTVKLPKTVHNQAIVLHCDVAAAKTDFPYMLHKGRYFRNGIEIIKDGRVVVLSSGTDIELSLVWGLYPAFSSLVNKGTTLNQLTGNDRILYNDKNEPAKYTDAETANYFYASLDVWKHDNTVDYSWQSGNQRVTPEGGGRSFGTGSVGTGVKFGGNHGSSATSLQYLPPSVKVSWILKLIKEQCGVDFVWTGDALDYINTLIIPEISRKSNELTFEGQFTATLPETSITSNDAAIKVNVEAASNVFSDAAGANVDKLTVAANSNVIFDIAAEWSWDNTTATPQGHGSYTVNGVTTRSDNYSHQNTYLRLTVTRKTDATTEDYIIGSKGLAIDSVPAGYKGVIRNKITGYGKIELNTGDTVEFHLTNSRGVLKGTKFYGGTIKATISSDENVPSGGYWPICYNLPKIKIIDFVKFLAAITGTFPRQIAREDRVEFVPYSVLWDNLGKAIDMTDRLIAQTSANKPKNIEYTVDEWAQNNYFRWKEDDTVTGNYDGDLTVENETLDVERDVVTFPFAATDGSNVPMWKAAESTSSASGGTFGDGSSSSSSDATTTETSKPSYSACKDRILRLSQTTGGLACGIFDINMQEIIGDKYADLQRTLQHAHVVKEKIKINDIELMNFDETIPVYFAQYGAYFAVTEIKAEDDGTAEFTMLQIDTNN